MQIIHIEKEFPILSLEKGLDNDVVLLLEDGLSEKRKERSRFLLKKSTCEEYGITLRWDELFASSLRCIFQSKILSVPDPNSYKTVSFGAYDLKIKELVAVESYTSDILTIPPHADRKRRWILLLESPTWDGPIAGLKSVPVNRFNIVLTEERYKLCDILPPEAMFTLSSFSVK